MANNSTAQSRKNIEQSAVQARKEIAEAAARSVELIAVAARGAADVISEAAGKAMAVNAKKDEATSGDHDLIVELNVKMGDLKADIKDLKDGTGTRLTKVEDEIAVLKIGYTQLRAYGAAMIFVAGIAQFLLGKYF